MDRGESNTLDALPHRPPFRFITRVIRIVPGECGEAEWQVRGDEPFFAGHFPSCPIVPGVLLAEALAQLSGLVGFLERASRADHLPDRPSVAPGMLAHLDVRLRRPVVPPAVIQLHSRLDRSLESLYQFEVEARVPAGVAANGRLALVVGARLSVPT